MQVSFSCNFSNPQTYDGSLPSTKTESWQFKDETCTYNNAVYAPSTTIASSTDIALYGSFTAGEVIMAFMMFVLIVIELVKMLARALDRVKTKKTFIAYSTNEVEIRDDL
jgi:hypothetical protein